MSNNPVRLFDGSGKPLTSTNGALDVNTELTATIDPTGLATSAKQNETKALIGEVQASPTSNTVLARLKAIGDYLAGILSVKIDQTTDGTTNAVVVKSITAGETHIGSIGGHTFSVTGTLTRPNDTPGAYSAKDEINTSTTTPTYITFSSVGRVNGGKGTLLAALKRTNNVSATSVLRLHLYNAAPTVNNDHAQFAELWADRTKKICYVDFTAPVAEGTGSDMAKSQSTGLNIPFACGAGKDLYGRVEVISAGSAPIASQVYDFTLLGFND